MPPQTPMFKMCGLHSENDVRLAASSSADFAGFVFAPGKREVEPGAVREWLQVHPLHGKKVTALFVNAPVRRVIATVEEIQADVIQLHGEEPPEEAAIIRHRTGKNVWKALPHGEYTHQQIDAYADYVDGFIIDAKVNGRFGGAGESFAWEHVPGYIKAGKAHRLPLFIAGGVRPENVEDLLAYHPAGIDISSGLEKDGIKDAGLLEQLEKRLNSYAADISR